MRVLVLGGHGFVGHALASELEAAGHQVISLSRRDGLDLMDLEKTRSTLTEVAPAAIFNAAAHVGSLHYVTTYAADVFCDNALMALNLYKAAASVSPGTVIVNPLSNCSYPGDADTHWEPEWWAGEVHDSVFGYGNAKRFIYVISRCFSRQYGVRSINFLVPNAFGPGDYTDPNKTHALNGMIIRMLQARRNGDGEFEIWGTGTPVREWGYIKDVVKILSLSLKMEEQQIYPVNIGQNRGYSIRQSAELIARAVGFDGRLVFNTRYQDGAPLKILDDREFRKMFPDFKFYDHAQGIRETVEYYEQFI